MMNRITLALASFAALACAYLLVPPPKPAAAAFGGQATFAGVSGGSANAQTISIPNLSANTPGVLIYFIPGSGLTNTGPTQINVSGIGLTNVLRPSSIGLVGFSGQEFTAGEETCITYNSVAAAYQLACNVDMTPIGRTVETRGAVAPRGSIVEDGSCVSQTTYAALFTVIGVTYGTCGSGLFKLPFSNGTGFVAFDNQGVNGPANRVTTASCANPNSPIECGSQLATLTPSLVPTLSLSVNSGATNFVFFTGNSFDGVNSGGAGAAGFNAGSGTPSIGTTVFGTTSGTGGSSVSHPVQNPMLPGIRAIRY